MKLKRLWIEIQFWSIVLGVVAAFIGLCVLGFWLEHVRFVY